MDDPTGSDRTVPALQHLAPDVVLVEMAEAGAKRAVSLTARQVLILSILAGGFITIGAQFSTLIATGTDDEGVQRLLEGFGFSVGFFLVVLSGALLFTEVNVELPATMVDRNRSRNGGPSIRAAILRLWFLAALGNMIGAFLLGQLIAYTQDYGPGYEELLGEVVASKVRYRETGGFEGVVQAALSGVLGNWLVGMAAFLSTMGRTIIGKYIPVLVTVMAFVAGGFLHSPANMAYLSLIQPLVTSMVGRTVVGVGNDDSDTSVLVRCRTASHTASTSFGVTARPQGARSSSLAAPMTTSIDLAATC